MKYVNGLDYDDWRIKIAGWDKTDPSLLSYHKRTRIPYDKEIEEKRARHMKQLHADGAPYAWIAKLYGMHRSHVMRIIKNTMSNTTQL